MARVSTSGFVVVVGKVRGRPSVPRPLGRAVLPRRWIAPALGITASALVAAVAIQIAAALRSPGLGGFPPIP